MMRHQKCGRCGSEYYVSSGAEVNYSRCWKCDGVAATAELERNYNMSKNLSHQPPSVQVAGEPAVVLDTEGNSRRKEEAMRTFDTGATRDLADGKFDYEGFFSPHVLEAFACYMHINQTQADGTMRNSDNWQKGIPTDAYIKSGWRHWFALWQTFRSFISIGHRPAPGIEMIAVCGLLFNVMGYLHERMKADGINEWLECEETGAIAIRAKELEERRAGK